MAVTEATLINAGVQVGLVDSARMAELRLEARRERIGLLEAVMRAGRFPEAALYQALADVRGIPFLLPRDLTPSADDLKRVPASILERRSVLPVRRGDELYLATADPDDTAGVEAAQRASGMRFKLALASPEALRGALRRHVVRREFDFQGAAAVDDADAIGVLDAIMKDAYLRRATDVHFEPEKDDVRVRLRVDGHLQEYQRPLSHLEGDSVVSRVKVLAGLDIAEQRLAQDGGMTYRMERWTVTPTDIRVATIPTRWGERATLRLLRQDSDGLDLARLGMPGPILESFRDDINRPHGIILVTGPTGSGKSTTLYAALRVLDSRERNILTVEDPIEQVVEGISQVQVSTKVDFAHALRSFLRHDPDVILVGEIRDLETAETALKAAMTGHLVLSTLHTNDAVGAVTRLADIGVPRYLIGATLVSVIAQRLVRRLCSHCRRNRAASEAEAARLNIAGEGASTLYEAPGCAACLGTGYLGRAGVFESLSVDRSLAEHIGSGVREEALREAAGEGYRTLWQDGREKILNGITDLAEVDRIGGRVVHSRKDG